MEEQKAVNTDNQIQTISKQVFDDTEARYQAIIAEKDNTINGLKKQVEDYSTILKHIDIAPAKPDKTSQQIVDDLLKGVNYGKH